MGQYVTLNSGQPVWPVSLPRRGPPPSPSRRTRKYSIASAATKGIKDMLKRLFGRAMPVGIASETALGAAHFAACTRPPVHQRWNTPGAGMSERADQVLASAAPGQLERSAVDAMRKKATPIRSWDSGLVTVSKEQQSFRPVPGRADVPYHRRREMSSASAGALPTTRTKHT